MALAESSSSSSSSRRSSSSSSMAAAAACRCRRRRQCQAVGTAAATAAKQPLLLLFLLLPAAVCSSATAVSNAGAQAHTHQQAMLLTDRAMGIWRYESIVQPPAAGEAAAQQPPLHVRVQLRFVCEGTAAAADSGGDNSGATDVHGFVSAFPLTTQPPVWTLVAPHYSSPPGLPAKQRPRIQLLDASSGTATQLAWLGPADNGLWRVHARLPAGARGPFQLHVDGADSVHQLPQPLCSPVVVPAAAEDGAAGAAGARLAGGLWNVLTTTSDSSIAPETLALLVLEHNTHHRALGFSGTILRSNKAEGVALLALPQVRAAVQHEGLFIWPWETEHIAPRSTHFWQKPKNQLTLLGMTGRRGARLAYFDLDEYLVLADGAAVDVTTARCLDGTPLLAGAGAAGGEGTAAGAPAGSWVFTRFQAKACPSADGDLECWRAGRAPSARLSTPLLHDLCPMSAAHGKHLLLPDRVDTLSVHATYSARFPGNVPVNATSCGHLLHFYSLIEARRYGVTGTLRRIPAATWQAVDPAASGRRSLVWPPGLAPLELAACQASPGARWDAVRRASKQA